MDAKTIKRIATHPEIVAIDGRWMVTGPNNPDGSGWTLCETDDEKACIQCWAEVNTRAMAMRVFDAMCHFDLVEASE